MDGLEAHLNRAIGDPERPESCECWESREDLADSLPAWLMLLLLLLLPLLVLLLQEN